MLTHTTAKGLQAEKIRQATRPQGRESDQELTIVSINWRRISTVVTAGAAVLAIVASSVGQASPVAIDEWVPSVTVESDNAPTWQATTSHSAQLGGPNLGPIRPD